MSEDVFLEFLEVGARAAQAHPAQPLGLFRVAAHHRLEHRDVLLALGHLSWAIYTLVAKPLLARHDALRISLLGCALSPLPLLPFALAEPVDPPRALAAFGWILLLAFVTTALGTFAWNRALHHIPAGTMAALIFVQPLVGLVAGTLLLHEPVGALSIAGAILILLGVAVEALQLRAPRPPS